MIYSYVFQKKKCKLMDWFLYDRELRYETIKVSSRVLQNGLNQINQR